MKNNLGQNIREYRIRSGLTQLELELKTELSSGTISRIETNQINPNKETVVKIIEVLELTAQEAAYLFNINVNEDFARIVKLSRSLVEPKLEDLLQNSVNAIASERKYIGVAIFLVKGDRLYAKTFTQTWYTKLFLEIIKGPFTNLSIPLTKTNNYFVKSVVEGKPQQSYIGRDFGMPMLSKHICDIVQKITKSGSFIAFPLIDKTHMGCIFFSKSQVDDFRNEYSILEAYAEFVMTAINNAQKVQHLEEELIKLKTQSNLTKEV